MAPEGAPEAVGGGPVVAGPVGPGIWDGGDPESEPGGVGMTLGRPLMEPPRAPQAVELALGSIVGAPVGRPEAG
jgi:hypothetical protein